VGPRNGAYVGLHNQRGRGRRPASTRRAERKWSATRPQGGPRGL